LGKLGLGLDANLIKSKDTDAIFQTLTTTFGNFAENEAVTTEAQFRRVGIAVDEAKEEIGAALLPIVERLAKFLISTAVPNLKTFIGALTGKGSLAEATADGTLGAFEFGKMVEKVIKTAYNFRGVLIALAAVLAGVFVVSKVAAGVAATIALIKALIVAYNALKYSSLAAGVAQAFALNPLLGVGAVALAAAVMAGASKLAGSSDVDTSNLSGGGVAGFSGTMPNGKPFSTDLADKKPTIKTPIIITPNTAGITAATKSAGTAVVAMSAGIPSNFNPSSFRMGEERGNTYNINVTGAVDKIGTARTIANVLNSEATNSGTFSNLGTSFLVAT